MQKIVKSGCNTSVTLNLISEYNLAIMAFKTNALVYVNVVIQCHAHPITDQLN